MADLSDFPADTVSRYEELRRMLVEDPYISDRQREFADAQLGEWLQNNGKHPGRFGYFWQDDVRDAYQKLLDIATRRLEDCTHLHRETYAAAREHREHLKAEKRHTRHNALVFIAGLVGWFVGLGVVGIAFDIDIDSPRGDRLIFIYMAVSLALGLLIERRNRPRR